MPLLALFFLFEYIKSLGMGSEAVFFGDGIFENEHFEWHQSQERIGAKEDKDSNAGKVLENVRNRREV